MSLFPAYSTGDSQQDIIEPEENAGLSKKLENFNVEWLKNPSFAIEVSDIPLPELKPVIPELNVDSNSPTIVFASETEPISKTADKRRSSVEVLVEHRNSNKKSKKQRRERSSSRDSVKVPKVPEENKCFFKDTKAEKGNLKVDTLHRPAVPLYHVRRFNVVGLSRHDFKYRDRKTKKNKRKKGNQKDRYYSLTTESIDDSSGVSNHESNMEEEISKKTAEFNKTLGEEPENVQTWLDYVCYQDTVCQFEKIYRRGGAMGARVAIERKLSILDKALALNFNSESLLKERCTLVEKVYPADEVAAQFATLLEKRPKSMAMWHGYIDATQFSLSICSVSKVVELYAKAMMKFHQLRRGAPSAQVLPSEENILELLLQCGLFLRQAGLHEQMWMLMKHYLELNLNQPSIKLPSTYPEVKLIDMEEAILMSELPLSELWVRVETLRESAHWLPWDAPTECEDPQRVVFAEDVSDMLHPITTQSLSFRLGTIVMTLLKVPLLPSCDTLLRWLGLPDIPWAIDSVETLLAIIFPFGVVETGVTELLSEVAELLVSPSYLSSSNQNANIGREHYLDFVTKVFHLCAESLNEPHRTAFYVWWLRFERFLVVLSENKICKALYKKKKVKATIKDFLKQEHNRNNLLFYKEYALIEKEFGNNDVACGILHTAISTQHRDEPVIGITNVEDRARLCSMYRSLAELLLSSKLITDKKVRALNLLVALGLGVSIPDLSSHRFTSEQQNSALSKFQHITYELFIDLDTMEALSMDGTEHLLPDFFIEWISCTAWLVYFKKTIWDAATFLENCLAKIPKPTESNGKKYTRNVFQRESLFESYITLLHYHCQETAGSYAVLQEVLHRGLKEFPNNMNFLTVAVRTENAEVSPWWKLKRLLEDTNSQPARMFLVFLAKQRQVQLENNELKNQNFNWLTGPTLPVSNVSYKNRTNSLFRQLIGDPCTKRCPLVWRLYLHFLFRHGDPECCRTTLYRAVEEIPWTKAIYLDGAKMLPGELQQVQDLIIEKELRLHVTPEELEVLRGSNA